MKEVVINVSTIYVVLDTNILLHHFDVVVQFVSDIERQALPITIVVPGVVIYELDGQKNRDGLAWFSRRASAWLLKKIRERKAVKGQANEETCKPTGNWRTRTLDEKYDETMNDGLILDCCLYFSRIRNTCLCSADVNLCNQCESNGIYTVSPSQQWDSRTIALAIFGTSAIDLRKFGKYNTSYKDLTSGSIKLVSDSTPVMDDDMMMIDDEYVMPEILRPSHALDLLHIQVVEHFTRLLSELAGRAGAVELGSGKENMMSMHAPAWQQRKRPYTEWDAMESLEYLWEKRRTRETSTRLDVFLSLPYRRRGARRGQDWSRRDWDVAVQELRDVARDWDETTIEESVDVLVPHVAAIFALRLRPTGI
ncbi:hypothetical protein AX15_007638 [Amanita polypyramis BW_CC]|nr:hypothetical protein AX15_007638 [Amanita polypyramis BW_CC]